MENPIQTVIDKHVVQSDWKGGMHFTGNVQGHTVDMDKLSQHGGDNYGPRPKPFMLLATSGCTGMEIINILNKMKINLSDFQVEVSGILGDQLPKVYVSIHTRYVIDCNSTDRERIEKAIVLVEEKYCGVIAMIKKFATYSSEIKFI